MLTTNINKLNQNTVWVVTWNDGTQVETMDMDATRLQERVSGKKIKDYWIKDNFYIVSLNGLKPFKKAITGKEKARKYVDKIRKSGGKIIGCFELTNTESRIQAGEFFKQLA